MLHSCLKKHCLRLNELIENKHFYIERIDLHNAGETLLHPNLAEMLKIISKKKKSLKEKSPVIISLLTNVMLLKENMTKEIVDSNSFKCRCNCLL